MKVRSMKERYEFVQQCLHPDLRFRLCDVQHPCLASSIGRVALPLCLPHGWTLESKVWIVVSNRRCVSRQINLWYDGHMILLSISLDLRYVLLRVRLFCSKAGEQGALKSERVPLRK